MTSIVSQAMAEAAEEIRRLRAEVRELKTQEMFNRSTIERMTAERDGMREQVARVSMYLWDDFPECCGNPVVAEYMGEQEMVCCGCAEPVLLSDEQIVKHLRDEFPDAARKDAT